MTVLIGFSCPAFTILGADGRSIAHDDTSDVDDETQKIYKTGVGVIAGAGRTDIIHAVTTRLEHDAPASNQEASEIIRAEVEKLGLDPNDPGLERTCWLASYATNTGEGPQTMLALANRDANYAFDPFQHNTVVVIRPAGMPEDVGRRFMIDAQAELDQRTGKAATEAHVPLCIQLIAALVRAISRLNDTVGPRWSVGVHLARNNATAVSDVGDDPHAMAWH